MSEIFSEIKESLTMRQVAKHLGYPVNRSGFILSPFRKEKTASCKLYRNSYYDFSTGAGGDLIKFTAVILNINNWEACQYLVQAFSLPISLSGAADRREEIERRQREQKRQRAREQEFKAALLEDIDKLKSQERIYQMAIDEKIYPPLSEKQGYVISELQKVSYKLDMLCAADCKTYRRMKPDVAAGLSSDRPQWLLDVLEILEEDGAFQATKEELAKIEKQRDFESSRQREDGKSKRWPEKRGEEERKQEQENLQQMSDSDLMMLLESLTVEG